MIRIGVMDEEEEYVGKLTAYLNRKNKGFLQCNAYTDADKLSASIRGQTYQVVMSTKKELLDQILQEKRGICLIWLTEEEQMHKDRIYCICRYQGGTSIAKALDRIIDREGLRMQRERKIIAVYSPVGRCGKTTLLLDYIDKQTDSPWLYIGMEDYGGEQSTDALLYYIKERRKEKILEQLEACQGQITSPFSPFDSKTISREDMIWLLAILKQQTWYQGIVFDIGTGVLQEIGVLSVFDQVIVPYLKEDASEKKKEHFVELVKAYGMEEWLTQIHFLDMHNSHYFASLVE